MFKASREANCSYSHSLGNRLYKKIRHLHRAHHSSIVVVLLSFLNKAWVKKRVRNNAHVEKKCLFLKNSALETSVFQDSGARRDALERASL